MGKGHTVSFTDNINGLFFMLAGECKEVLVLLFCKSYK